MQITAIARPISCQNGLTPKLTRVMKLTAILLLTAALQVTAHTEGQTITFNVKNAPLKEVFREIQRQSGLNVLVDESLLKKAARVTLKVTDMPVPNVHGLYLHNEPVSYAISQGRIIIKRKPVLPAPLPQGACLCISEHVSPRRPLHSLRDTRLR